MSRLYDDYKRIHCETVIDEERDGYYSFKDTVFYGEKGGMPSDEGTINGHKVVDLKWEGDTLFHKVDGQLEDPIVMDVDWKIREANTAVQTAFHLMDGYFGKKDMYLPAVGVALNNQWFELNTKEITEEDIEELEEKRKLIKEDYKIGETIANKIFINDFEPTNEFIPTSTLTEYTKSYLDENGIKKTEQEIFLIRGRVTTNLCELINTKTIYKAYVEFGEEETHLRVMKKIGFN